jgi:twitching motility protein PilT
VSASKPPLGARPVRALDPRREEEGPAGTVEIVGPRDTRVGIREERVPRPAVIEDRSSRPTSPPLGERPRGGAPDFFPSAAMKARARDESVIARVQVPPHAIAHEELPLEPTFSRTSRVEIPEHIEPPDLDLFEEKDSRPPERRPSAAPIEVQVAPMYEAHAPERPIRPLWTDPMSLVQEWVVLPGAEAPTPTTRVSNATRSVEEISVPLEPVPPLPVPPRTAAAPPRPEGGASSSARDRAALPPGAPTPAAAPSGGPALPPELLQTLQALSANPDALKLLRGEAPAPAKPVVTAAPGTPGQNRIDRFLKLMNDRGASDLHLSVGRPPIFRLSGRMEPIRYRTLDNEDFRGLLEPIAPPHLWAEYLRSGDMDFAYEVPGLSRFRVNLFKQERGMGAVFRIIPTKLMTVAQLGLPEPIKRIVSMRSGLVLVTGPTGSGKSTTLSAIINEMNATRRMHFVTIEDPIEFVHPNKLSLMTQREIGPHSKSFSTALRAAVREDPDAVLVGEMRDLETISMALSAAETGVLVFGTLHTNSAAKTLDRIINVFPADKQAGVRGTLASVTKAVVAQQLLRKKGGGRCAAVEILFASPAMSSLLRDGKTHQIGGLIKLGKKEGMIAMDDALRKLADDGLIDAHAALEKAIDKDEMRKWLKDRGDAVPDATD